MEKATGELGTRTGRFSCPRGPESDSEADNRNLSPSRRAFATRSRIYSWHCLRSSGKKKKREEEEESARREREEREREREEEQRRLLREKDGEGASQLSRFLFGGAEGEDGGAAVVLAGVRRRGGGADGVEEVAPLQLQRLHSFRRQGKPLLPRRQLLLGEESRGRPHGRRRPAAPLHPQKETQPERAVDSVRGRGLRCAAVLRQEALRLPPAEGAGPRGSDRRGRALRVRSGGLLLAAELRGLRRAAPPGGRDHQEGVRRRRGIRRRRLPPRRPPRPRLRRRHGHRHPPGSDVPKLRIFSLTIPRLALDLGTVNHPPPFFSLDLFKNPPPE